MLYEVQIQVEKLILTFLRHFGVGPILKDVERCGCGSVIKDLKDEGKGICDWSVVMVWVTQ